MSHALEEVAFPKLEESLIADLSHCAHAKLRSFEDGETLIAAGDRDFKFFVITSGAIEILDTSGDAAKTITVHRAGGFTGDVSHLTGNPAIITAVTRGATQAYEISTEALRQMLAQCPKLSDIVLQAFLARRQLLRECHDFTGLRVIGSRYSRDTFRIREFLAKNRQLFTWLDLESDPDVQALLAHFGVSAADTPVVALGQRVLLRNPTNRELAEAIGIRRPIEKAVFDLAVVGAGPAGLAAAVYGASEGLNTILVERTAPGGQAGMSMRIENYLGFPTGITGGELTDRAVMQANKFGARLSVPSPVAQLSFDKRYSVLTLESGETVVAKCLLIATGADYRRLDVDGCEKFEGRGVYYAATFNEAQLCRGTEVVVVGGGNSAGQAAVFLATQARRVFHLIRGDDLYKNMSSYLAQRIEQTENIELLCSTHVHAMHGDDHLAGIEIANRKTGEKSALDVQSMFSFIGAVPRTDWLPEEIETDEDGFILTGRDVTRSSGAATQREAYLLETSRRGVFAAGDARAGSVKRVASAVGEGSMAVQFVHACLAEM